MPRLPDHPDPEWDDETRQAYDDEVNYRVDEARERRAEARDRAAERERSER